MEAVIKFGYPICTMKILKLKIHEHMYFLQQLQQELNLSKLLLYSSTLFVIKGKR